MGRKKQSNQGELFAEFVVPKTENKRTEQFAKFEKEVEAKPVVVAKGERCIACSGTGQSSRDGVCYPCG